MTHNQHLNYRPDIDGLRAVAVLLVLIFHGFPNFIKGGFIGVDIFFVISGYLITSIILKSQARGDFSLIEFYSRRIKRIFPALIVVLLFSLVFGWFSLLADEYQALGKHVMAGALYISNFVLQSEAGYFDTDSDFKPLLHLWSLGIEEQFYLAFPLLLIVMARLKFNPLFLIVGGLIISFGLNVFFIDQNPTGVFFYPQSRVWELLIGSLAAHTNLVNRSRFDAFLQNLPLFKCNKNANLSSNVLAWLSLTLILCAWFGLNKTKITFPNGWALLPTLGAAGLILAGEQAWFNRNILANKYPVWLGLISYPLYLWHWPLLALIRTIEMEKPKGLFRLLALVISVFLAWATYYFVEKRLRFHDNGKVVISLLISLTVIGFAGYQISEKEGFPNRFHFKNIWNEGELGLKTWKQKWLTQKSCSEKFGRELEFCLITDINSPPTVILVGDSHANHLYPGLLHHAMFEYENFLNLGEGSCPPYFDIPKERCHFAINHVLEIAEKTPSIHTIIFTNRDIIDLDRLNNSGFKFAVKRQLGIEPPAYENMDKTFRQLMKTTLQRLLNQNKRIIFIMDIPKLDFKPTACINRPWNISRVGIKTPCATEFKKIETENAVYRKLIAEVLSEFPSVTVWDPTGAFCDETYCWAIKDKKMLYRDDDHLNEVGSLYLGKYLNEKYPKMLRSGF